MRFQLRFLTPGPWLLPFLSCVVWCRLHCPRHGMGGPRSLVLQSQLSSLLPEVSTAPLILVYSLVGWVREEFCFPLLRP